MVVWMEKIGGEIYCRHQDHKVKNFLYEKKIQMHVTGLWLLLFAAFCGWLLFFAKLKILKSFYIFPFT